MIKKAADFPVFKGGHNPSKTSILNTARNLIVKLEGGIRKKGPMVSTTQYYKLNYP